jgi:broad specificity phosphatase PhoE
VLVIVRHGRTAANAQGRLLGRADPALDADGLAQATCLGAALQPDRVVASPLIRARQTAEAFGLPIEIDERWIELDYGDLEGTPTADVPRETWAEWRADVCYRPQGGESLLELSERVAAACDDLAEEAKHRDIAVVTHVSPVKAAVAWALGVGCETSWRTYVAPASVSRIAVGPWGPSLHTFNETSHLTT